jgi:ATPase family associated with various cellular activities (AAA)
MSRPLGELVGLPLKTPGALSHPGYQPAGSHDRPWMQVPEELELFVLRHIARHYTPSLALLRPSRFAVIQGARGEGKSESVRVSCSRHGIDVVLVAASEFAGETENAGSAALARLAEAVLAITAREGRPLVICLDDFDLSIAARLSETQYTVDTQLLTGALQHLADTGALRTANDFSVPIIMTGNDFTNMRSSLLRPGRALFFEYAPSFEEKCAIIAKIFGVRDADVRGLVAAHRKQPIAFFAELRSHALDEDLDLLIQKYGLNLRAIESHVRAFSGAGDLAQLHKRAAAALARGAKNYLRR